MPWNPEKYNQFKAIRYQPFFDLVEMISEDHFRNAVDIGCGTGEQTSILSERFDQASFLGIDSSKEMLAQSSKFENERLQFRIATIEAFADDPSKLDLIFSNAALQWSDDHVVLFPKIIAKLNAGGQLAVQMPSQKENMLNTLLLELVNEKPYKEYLDGYQRLSPLLTIDEYAQLMFDSGLKNMQIVQKVYPIIADNADTLFDFISGSALVPYLEKLNETAQALFIEEYKRRIGEAFKKFPAIYAFKRLLLYGRKE